MAVLWRTQSRRRCPDVVANPYQRHLRAGRLRQRSRASPSGRRGNPLATAGSSALRRLELDRTSEETNEALGPECARRRIPQPSHSSPRFFRFRAHSAERFLKVRGVERPLACVMPTVIRALLRNLLSPRWSRPEWLRNQSGDRTVVPLCGATPPPETHPGPKARRHCVKLCLSGNRPAAGSWAGSARNSAGGLIVLGDPLIFSGAGSARALRAHQSYREHSFLGRQVSLNRGRKCNRAPRLIGALSHARISQDCKQLNRANARRRGIPPRPMAGWRCPFCCVGDDRKMGRATRAT